MEQWLRFFCDFSSCIFGVSESNSDQGKLPKVIWGSEKTLEPKKKEGWQKMKKENIKKGQRKGL